MTKMIVRPYWIAIVIVLSCNNVSEQELKKQEQQVNEDAAKQVPMGKSIIASSNTVLNSIYCVCYNDDRYITEGTCFIAIHKQKYYLVSNYHVLIGRDANDTSRLLDTLKKEVNKIKIRFHTKDGGFIDTIYDTKNGKGERLIISQPARLVNRRTLDLALYPITSYPTTAQINTIDIDSISKDWVLQPSEKFYIYGYRYEVQPTDHLAGLDELTIVPDKSFGVNDKYILSANGYSLKGASGAPTYVVINGKIVFIGIHSETVPSNLQILFLDIFSHPYNADISVTLSAMNLFDKSLFGNKNL